MSAKAIDRVSDVDFRVMSWFMAIEDLFSRKVSERAGIFGIEGGMTVVDYGCGPGRYTVEFSRLVGEAGKVYAVDVQELALQMTNNRCRKLGLVNVITVHAAGYDSGLPDNIADMVLAIDLFHGVKEPGSFLGELARILKSDGALILDDGHQARSTTIRKLEESGIFTVEKESEDHLRCVLKGGAD